MVPLANWVVHTYTYHPFSCREKKKLVLAQLALHFSERLGIDLEQSGGDLDLPAQMLEAVPLKAMYDKHFGSLMWTYVCPHAPTDGTSDVPRGEKHFGPVKAKGGAPNARQETCGAHFRGTKIANAIGELRKHVKAKHDDRRMPNYEGRWTQLVRIAGAGESYHIFSFPDGYQPVNPDNPPPPSFVQANSDAAPKTSTWMDTLGWVKYRTSLKKFTFAVLKSLVQAPSKRCVSNAKGKKERSLETGLLIAGQEAMPYLSTAAEYVYERHAMVSDVMSGSK